MDVKLYQSYLNSKDVERDLRKKVSLTQNALSELEVRLAEISSQVSDTATLISEDNLVTAKSVKVMNGLLEQGCSLRIRSEICPVNFAQLSRTDKGVHLDAVLAQPLFHGWRTETPYVSYSFCPLSVTVPPKPDDNHIPEFVSVLSSDYDLSCWEVVDGELVLYSLSGEGKIVFVLKNYNQEKI